MKLETINEITTITSSILGHEVILKQARPLVHSGTGVIYGFFIDEKHYILKRYMAERTAKPTDAPRFIEVETTNAWNIDGIKSFSKPKYYGCFEDAYLMQYVDGVLFDDLLKTGTPAQIDAKYRQSIETLANLHLSSRQLRDRRRLRRSFQSSTLQKRIESSVERLYAVGFNSMRQRGFDVEAQWQRVAECYPIKDVVEALATDNDYYLGHGDYKPNNLICGNDGNLYVFDWLGMSRAQPWYDLAYLTVFLTLAQKDAYLIYYLDTMKQKGELLNLGPEEARRKFRYGILYQQLIRADSNAGFIALREDMHHVNEFRCALETLAELTG